jgi:hypothetical protein
MFSIHQGGRAIASATTFCRGSHLIWNRFQTHAIISQNVVAEYVEMRAGRGSAAASLVLTVAAARM